MELVAGIFFFMLGAIIGSFLNVVILRYGTGRTLWGRSHCMSCRYTLQWYDLIPIGSYLILQGRCRSCKSAFSSRYAWVEFVTAVLFTLAYVTSGISIVLGIWLVIISLLVVLAVYDLRHKILPDAINYTLIAISFLLLFVEFTGPFVAEFVWPMWSSVLSGLLVPLPFFLLWLLSKGRAFGLGDVKLMVAIGWLFPLPVAITVVFLSFWLGVIFVAGWLIFRRTQLGRFALKGFGKQMVPFGPFLVAAVLIGYYAPLEQLVQWYLNW
jgi:prepilin signal peptidase PulO-like enzyme (type II secretory pathway)